MSILIHIGFPKTGTTWLQTCVFTNIVNTHFVGPNKKIISCLTDKSETPIYAEIKQEFFTHSKKSIIYSDPELSGLISFDWNNGENSKIIVKRLKALFSEAKILIIIRNQLDFLVSGYAYYIRKGGTYKFNKYFEKIKNANSGFSLNYLKYNTTISEYSGIFGNENVKVLLYEELLNNKEGVIKELVETYSWKLNIANIDFSKKNQRLRTGLLHFFRFFNYFSNKEVSEKSYIFNFPFIYNKLNNKYEYLNYYKCFGSPVKIEKMIGTKNQDYIKQYFVDSNKELCKYFDKELLKKHNYSI